MTNKRKNVWMIKEKDGFNGVIYNMQDFSDFFYFDATEKIENGFFEYRTYMGYNCKNNIQHLKLIKQGFEDKSIFPNDKYLGLNKIIDLN